MNYFDVFNGDADGICALIQLRLHAPVQTTLITGVKRNIQLLDNLSVNPGDQLTVLDISFKTNYQQVYELLAKGAHLFYVDHHQSGEIPKHPHLKTIIDTSRNICTSLLVNQHLHNKFQLWAIVAAYGDNLKQPAEQLASTLQINTTKQKLLENLGIYINYNSYGRSIDDLHFTPVQLYLEMAGYASPLQFIADKPLILEQLETGYHEDINHALQIKPLFESPSVKVILLPDTTWARRVSGVFGNHLANATPDKAHAVLSHNEDNSFLVSVRAPLTNKIGADDFCSRFPTGGGRKAAAGINYLPEENLDDFIQQFDGFYGVIARK